MKITEKIKEQVLEHRSQGVSFSRIAKETGISRSSVVRIVKDNPAEDEVIEAKVLKYCPNPRILMIYFKGDWSNFAKCVVRPGINYQIGKTLEVKKVETSEEPLYRLA